MRKKPDLSKYKINYCRNTYDIDLYGAENPNAVNGLYDLAGKCAELICDQLDGDVFFAEGNEDEIRHEIIQDEIYRLIKFYMLRPLNQSLANQKSSEM